MKLKISFQELSKLQEEILSNQPAISLEIAKQQVERLKSQNTSSKKMRPNSYIETKK